VKESSAESLNSPPRVVLVFISSTFIDREAEREYPAEVVFPELRKGGELGGRIPEKRFAMGDHLGAHRKGVTLAICLATIHQCRPYFVGILGERYGCVPKRKKSPPKI